MRRRHSQRGNAMIETALFLPFLFILLFGMVEMARVAFTYYSVQKALYTVARHLGTQQRVNFCDDGDASIAAAKNLAVTGATDGASEPLIANFTADMIAVRIERYNASTQELATCDCSSIGCDAAQGGGSPDFIVVSLPQGYPIRPVIPMMSIDPIPLRPVVRVPFGGT